MREYSGFATVYDRFMDNVPYEEWTEYLTGLLRENGVTSGIVAELGCGTGKVTRLMRDRGFDMIGIDLSPQMLQIAREQEKEGDDSILYLLQDMREIELYGTVAAVISLCDSMNYITEDEDLLKVFRLVNLYLDPGGIFVFDLNTTFYYSKVLGENVICENRPFGSFIWENYYDSESRINEFDLTIYCRNDEKRQTYERYEETHYQRAFPLGTVKKLLKKSGLELKGVYEVMTHDAPTRTTERVYFVAGKGTESHE